mmetsp:Transcript_6828/g.9970  ORF Transcript_6828/g.9970 Transcript_6828/m.9970 type:complete len:117 (+) Transcript_6828:46-396(+)
MASIFGAILGIGATLTLGRVAYKTVRQTKFYRKFTGGSSSGGPRYLQGGFEPEMTRDEAYKILGVPSRASSKDIQKAHRRLMLKNHPDAGGSTFLSTKINEAKDMLVGKQQKKETF